MCFIHKGYRDYQVQQENVHLNLFCSGVEQIRKLETKQLTVVFQQLTVFFFATHSDTFSHKYLYSCIQVNVTMTTLYATVTKRERLVDSGNVPFSR